MNLDKRKSDEEALLKNIRANLPTLEQLLAQMDENGIYEDRVYRFYHTSFKVYSIQSATI